MATKGTFQRKTYLDMIRLICVLLLIPAHTFLIYNTFGEGQYVLPAAQSDVASFIVALLEPCFMNLLFVIAGMSSRYSLQKRSAGAFAAERLLRIGLPLLTGVAVLMPFLAYLGDVSNNNYSGGYWAHYLVFLDFSSVTNLSGYDGHFGVGYLWFLEYLLLISLLALPLYLIGQKLPLVLRRASVSLRLPRGNGWVMPLLLLLGVLQALAHDIISTGFYSFSQYFVLFLIGLFVLHRENVQEQLEKYRLWLGAAALVLWLAFSAALILGERGWIYGVLQYAYGYMVLLAVLAMGRRHMNTRNTRLLRAANSAQLIYILHNPILMAFAFVLLPLIDSMALEMAVVIICALVLTCLAAELVRVTPVVRTLFGMKPKKA